MMTSGKTPFNLLNDPVTVNLDLLLGGNGMSGIRSYLQYSGLTNCSKTKMNNYDCAMSTISALTMSDSLSMTSASISNQSSDDTSHCKSPLSTLISNNDNVSTHVYWDAANVWTLYNDNNSDPYYNNKNWDNLCLNNKWNPLLAIIKPNTFENINSLSYFNQFVKNNANNCYNINNKEANCKTKLNNNNKIGSFKNYIFMSEIFTNQLKKLIDKNTTLVDINRIYQFEIRYFQHCLLNGNISFIKLNKYKYQYSSSGSSDGNEFLIWRFCHYCSKRFNYEPIYGIACRNINRNININDRNYQPWQCISIQKQSSLLNYFHLKNVFGTRKEKHIFLSLLPQSLKCDNVAFNPTFKFESNHAKIAKLLNKGYDKYLAQQRRKQPQSVYCNRNGRLEKTNNGDTGNYARGYDHVYDTNSNIAPRMNGSINNDSLYSTNNNHRTHKMNIINANRKNKKLSNEDKFQYLEYLANVKLNIKFEQFTEMIVQAIDKAFLFAKKYPNTVLTQAYMDEENEKVIFENVLLLEIYDINNKNMAYKFGIPIELKESNNQYIAKTILTPQMAIENIMLNTPNVGISNLHRDAWIYDMTNNESFYKILNE